MSTMPPVTAGELLGLWEKAGCAGEIGGAERADALLAAQGGAPPASLGRRNAALVALRARLFGDTQPLRSTCPGCGATAEFAVDCPALAAALLPPSDAAQPQRLAIDGHLIEFRVPAVADLRHAARAGGGTDGFVGALLERCISRCERADGTTCAPHALPTSAAAALSRRLEELEPGASVSFALTCPECGAQWTAAMDVGEVLWTELRARAERLLLDVDALARGYGWSEPQVLALSAARRAAYLQLVGAG
jgi:hypothetical protein